MILLNKAGQCRTADCQRPPRPVQQDSRHAFMFVSHHTHTVIYMEQKPRKEEEQFQVANMESEVDGEERVIATAEQIVMSLGTTHGMTQDMLHILSAFDHRFSNITDRLEAHLEERLLSAQQLLLRWEGNSASSRHHPAPAMIWDGPPDQARTYLEAVEEIQHVMKALHVADDDKTNDTLERARSVHAVAMGRLLQEFRHALLHHREPLRPDSVLSLPSKRVSFHLHSHREEETEGEIEEGEDRVTVACDSFRDDDELSIDLVRPAAVPALRDIAKRLIAGKHEQECCQVYSSARRVVLEENLLKLGAERLGIEDIQKTGWEQLEDKIKKWIQAIKIAVRVLFAREKDLCNQIFEDLNLFAIESCFSEACRAPMMRLLSFSEAVAMSRRSPEKLFRILDIYETLSDLVPDINNIFCEEESIREEALGILVRLGEAARFTFKEFAIAIQTETSRRPIPGGAIHPLTRYVMNYIRFLFDYTDTLNLLIVSKKEERTGSPPRKFFSTDPGGDRRAPVGSLGFADEYRYNEDEAATNLSPLAQQLFSILELLKCNLDGKSKLYKDSALTYLFLMNNVHYIVQKVRGSELIVHLGDDWVRKHSGQVRQYATNYQRAAWNKVLGCLKDEGIHFTGSYSSSVSKGALKERFKRFNTVFEEVYKIQTHWTVPDPQLREELRISITEKLLPAYRSFMGRFGMHLEGERHVERYLKYTPEELENYLLDLFEGLTGSMQSQRTKSLP